MSFTVTICPIVETEMSPDEVKLANTEPPVPSMPPVNYLRVREIPDVVDGKVMEVV